MTRRIPIVSTVLVAAAVLAMIGLGVWQLQRKQWKEALIARYQAAQAMNSDVPWPTAPDAVEGALYRHSRVDCDEVTGTEAIAGRSANDQPGWAHIAHCRLADGGAADVALGWSNDPAAPLWQGGEVFGFVAPAGAGARLVAAPPQAGLAQLAPPDATDVSTTPAGHLLYAVQWFAFAAIALTIYALALRKRWRR